MKRIKYLILLGIILILNFGAKVQGAPTSIPTTPTNIKTTANDNKIVVSWDKVEDANEYEIEVDGVIINNSQFTVFEHDNLLPLTTHHYRLRAVNELGHSQWSPTISYKTANPKLTEINTVKISREIIQPRYGFETVTLNNKIYIIGGYGDNYIDSIEEYNPETDLWEIKTVMPTKRYQASVAAQNNRIYLIGGYNNEDGELNKVEVYDIENDTWSELKPMPTKRNGAKAVLNDNKIYVIGGYNQEEKALDIVEVYNIDTNTWTSISPMPTKRSLMEAIISNNKIYVMGGYNGFVLGDIETYDIEKDIWEKKGQMPIPRHSFSAIPFDQRIILVGGYNTLPFNTIELYNPQDNRFILQNTLRKERFASGAVVVQDELYVIGGSNEAMPLNVVEKAYTIKDDAPSNFTLYSVGNSIQLTWDKVDEETLYEIEINGKLIKNGFNNSYTQEDISENKKYYYRVRGISDKGVTKWSSFKTYIKYADEPSAYAYIGDRTKDIDNYETIDVFIMTKNIEDIYSAEIEGMFNGEQIQINNENVNQVIFSEEKAPYQYLDLEKGRFYLNVSLIGKQQQKDGLTNIYKITLNLKTLDTTALKINKINLVDSTGHIIDITNIYDLDIPSLY